MVLDMNYHGQCNYYYMHECYNTPQMPYHLIGNHYKCYGKNTCIDSVDVTLFAEPELNIHISDDQVLFNGQATELPIEGICSLYHII